MIDPYPPASLDHHGIHGAIWNEIDPTSSYVHGEERPLTLVSYCASQPVQAYVEPIAVGTVLPEMPLFLDPHWYVSVLLEDTYLAAWEAVPARWRRRLSE